MKQPEQYTADLIRALLKLKLTDIDELSRMIDELQIRLIEREGYNVRATR